MTLQVWKLATLPAGRHPDGRYGLYFNVTGNSRTWMQRLTLDGKRRMRSLGPWPVVSLAEARDAAFENVRLRHRGINPFATAVRQAVPTFDEACDAYIKLQAAGWKIGSRNETNWRSSLAHATAIADSPVDGIMTDDVADIVLALIRAGKAPTAKAVRQRIRLIFDWCIGQGFRSDNPANGAIDAVLPKTKHRTEHRASVEHGDVAAVLAMVEAINEPTWHGIVGAFKFAVLTASRTAEVLGMSWSEVDGDTWTIPASRMKAGKAHRVPLSAQALQVLQEARQRTHGAGLVFRSPRGKRLGDASLRRVAKRIEMPGTVHGMRGAFKSWAMDSGIDRAVAEFALAHAYMGDTEAAYVRTDLIEKRRPVMQVWADHVNP